MSLRRTRIWTTIYIIDLMWMTWKVLEPATDRHVVDYDRIVQEYSTITPDSRFHYPHRRYAPVVPPRRKPCREKHRHSNCERATQAGRPGGGRPYAVDIAGESSKFVLRMNRAA